MCEYNDVGCEPRFTRLQAETVMAAYDAAYQSGGFGDDEFYATGNILDRVDAEISVVIAILKQHPDAEFERRYPKYIAALKTGW